MRKRLVAVHPNFSNIIFWSAVIFPYVSFSTQSEEWHSWQVIDNRLFTKHPFSVLIANVLDNAYSFITNQRERLRYHTALVKPNHSQCLVIIEALRPNFEFYESPRSRTRRQNEELKNYTAEQFAALDAMEINPRVLFCGPAGTGKTMLAIEAARRKASPDHKVLLLCYNRLLGAWLEEQTAVLQPYITCRTIHRHMLAVAGFPTVGSNNKFWQDELPSIAIDKLLETDRDEYLFEELIIDETQDVLQDSYLDFLDLSLKGGLHAGHWQFFGDFEKQTIYNSSTNLSLEQLLQVRKIQAPIYSLRVNCRNTPRIVEMVHLLGGLSPGYSKILRPDNRIEPNLLYYTDSTHQQLLLVNTMEQLFTEGFSGRDIVILSPKAGANSTPGTISSLPWRERLRPVDIAKGEQIRYGTIHAFKGLEAPVVVVTDIDKIDRSTSAALFYIAITRALHRLVLLMHDNVKQDILNLLNLPSYETSEE
ncbi:MAG: ATP-binding domain-containing protein [Ktedonobacteraceae bacterium]